MNKNIYYVLMKESGRKILFDNNINQILHIIIIILFKHNFYYYNNFIIDKNMLYKLKIYKWKNKLLFIIYLHELCKLFGILCNIYAMNVRQ